VPEKPNDRAPMAADPADSAVVRKDAAGAGEGGDGAGRVTVGGNALLPEGSRSGIAARLTPITDIAAFKTLRDLGLITEHFAAKFYHGHENCDRRGFESLLRPFLELSHPHVLPIVGFIPPTKNAGPIILSPFHEGGSLEAVLTRVRRNDPPPFWTTEGKVRVFGGLLSGLLYLHSRGIVHGDLKPSDVIIDSDGSPLLCDFLTAQLEASKFTRASQVGGPSYSAPEVSGSGDAVNRTLKADVFSFGVILYEILFGTPVFPSTLGTATIWRKALDPKPGARPVIPASAHPALRSCIQRCWVPDPQRRPKLEDLWTLLRDANFGFPDVPIALTLLSPGG
jgi:serine/threonine protein kinase